jgi:signal transduction histidine kinase
LAEGSEREDALVINQEIQRLERIVQDFLQFARPSAPQVETVSATILFEQVKRLLGAQLDNGHLELKIDCPAEIRVRADPQQIEQVLINLVQNAAESMAGGCSITLRASTKPPLLAGRQSQVLLDVIDTGQGIAPEIQNRLFDPFFSTKEGGAGLGLSIATRIVERHGGWLRYKTQLGRGTTFSFILPGAPESKHED